MLIRVLVIIVVVVVVIVEFGSKDGAMWGVYGIGETEWDEDISFSLLLIFIPSVILFKKSAGVKTSSYFTLK